MAGQALRPTGCALTGLCALVLLTWTVQPQPAQSQRPEKAPQTTPAKSASAVKYSCDVKGLRAIRKAAKLALDAGEAQRAVALFAGFTCHLNLKDEGFAVEWAWMHSDRSYALYKAGHFRKCHVLAARESHPYRIRLGHTFSMDAPFMKALAHNAKLCKAELDKLWADFVPRTKCPISKYHFAHGVPPALLPSGTTACLSLGAGAMNPESDLYEGGDVKWIERVGRRVSTRLLGRDLGDAPCHVAAVSFRRKQGKIQIMLSGQGRDCSGGMGALSFRDVYELSAEGLKQIDAHTVSMN